MKTLLSLLLLLLVHAGSCLANQYEYQDVKYELINDSTCRVVDLNKISGEWEIPGCVYHDGKSLKVAELRPRRDAAITKLTVPASFTGSLTATRMFSELKAIEVAADNELYASLDGIAYDKDFTKVISCPIDHGGVVVLPETVTDIGESAFCMCQNLVTVRLPNTIERIGSYAFQNTSIDYFVLPRADIQLGEQSLYFDRVNKLMYPGNLDEYKYFGWRDLAFNFETEEPEEVWFLYESFRYCPSRIYFKSTDDFVYDEAFVYSADHSWLYIAPDSICGHYEVPSNVVNIDAGAFACCNKMTGITVPSSVKALWNNTFCGCFYGCENLTNATINADIKYLGAAFKNCTALKDVILPQTLTKLSGTFEGCLALESLTLPASVDTIWYSTFSGCKNLKDFEMPQCLKHIGGSAFADCSSLQHIAFPQSLTHIGNSAFKGCSEIEFDALPNGLISVGGSAFSGCTRLTALDWPLQVTEIPDGCFEKCKNLSHLSLHDNITKIGNSALSGCSSLADLSLPASLTHLGNYALSGCSSITSLMLPESLSEIGDACFQGCRSLTEFNFPRSLTKIGAYTFSNCNFKNFELHEGLESIGKYAFSGCKLTELTLPSTLSTLGERAFDFDKLENLVVRCRNVGDGWFANIKTPNLILDAQFESIGSRAFYNAGITDLYLPEGLTSIGEGAFSGCNLAELTLPSTLTTLGERAFDYDKLDKLVVRCRNVGDGWFANIKTPNLILDAQFETIGSLAFYNAGITELSLPPSTYRIGDEAFSNNGITSLTLPKSVQQLGAGAFAQNPITKLVVNCQADIKNAFDWAQMSEVSFGDDAITAPTFTGLTNLKTVILPTPMETIADNAFKNCTSLVHVEMPANLVTVGAHAFEGCTSLSEIDMSRGVETIGEYAFADCVALMKAKLSDELKALSDGLFNNCTALEKVYYGDKIRSVGAKTFYNCSQLRSVSLPNGITEIPENAMAGCCALNEVLAPNTVVRIGRNAFAGCSALQNLGLGTEIYELGELAFDGCEKINTLHCMAKVPPYADRTTFPLGIYKSAVVTIPEQSLTRYNISDPWMRFDNYLTVSGSISLSHYEIDMAGNECFQLGVYGTATDIEWTSSNPSVAYANKCGLIVAMGITGSTVITAHVEGEEVSCHVRVSAIKRETAARCKLRHNTPEIESQEPFDVIIESISGNPPMVNARLIPIGSCTVISWPTSDDGIATVENGIVTVTGSGDVEFGVNTQNGLRETLPTDTDDISVDCIRSVNSENVSPNTDGDVYDLAGRCILRNAKAAELCTLNKGVYIMNGQKLVIR